MFSLSSVPLVRLVAIAALCSAVIQTASSDDYYGAVAVIPGPDGGVGAPTVVPDYVGPYGIYGFDPNVPYHERVNLGNWSTLLSAGMPSWYAQALKLSYNNTFTTWDPSAAARVFSNQTKRGGSWNFPVGDRQYYQISTSGSKNNYNVNLNWQVMTPNDGVYNVGYLTVGGTGLKAVGGGIHVTANVSETAVQSGPMGATRYIKGNIGVSGAYDYNISTGARSYTLGVTGAYGSDKAGMSFTFDVDSNLLFVSVHGEIPTNQGWNMGIRADLPNYGGPLNGGYSLKVANELAHAGVIVFVNKDVGTVSIQILDNRGFINWIRGQLGLNPI